MAPGAWPTRAMRRWPDRAKAVDGEAGDAFEVEVQPRLAAAGPRAAESGEGETAADQFVDARVVPLGAGDQPAVGDAAADGTAEKGVRVLAGAAQEDHEVQIVLGQFRLDAFEKAHEERVAVLDGVVLACEHEGNRVGDAAAQALAGMVGSVAERGRGLLDARAGVGVDFRTAVERARDGADRQTEMIGELSDVHCGPIGT